ncbi:GIY-YIG nuclease family protein [Shigella flexneri]
MEKETGLLPFKAFIKIVKSKQPHDMSFIDATIIYEKLIYAKDKKDVKKILMERYPQFFPENKVYEKESVKNPNQIFYVLIYPLREFEIILMNEGEWVCSGCGQKYENKYLNPPKNYTKIGKDYNFCNYYEKGRDPNIDPDICLNLFKGKVEKNGIEPPDNMMFVSSDSCSYIYKVTEKATGKSYIGKTKNAPFFRWWEHLKHSRSPFGLHLRNTDLKEWTFEVLETLQPYIKEKEILRIESEYILKYDSINNGYNSVISNKDAGIINSINEEVDLEVLPTKLL